MKVVKVFMNVRVSQQDAIFYVRNGLPDIPENHVFQGHHVIGLFGKNAPNHADRFLSYIDTNFDPPDDNPPPRPSYGQANFPSFDQASGLLIGGKYPVWSTQKSKETPHSDAEAVSCRQVCGSSTIDRCRVSRILPRAI